MKWVLIIWLSSPNNYSVFDRFSTEELCLDKQATLTKAFQQAKSKVQSECRLERPGDAFKKGELSVSRYTFR